MIWETKAVSFLDRSDLRYCSLNFFFSLTAYLSESHYGSCYDQVGERRRASPDFIGTLFQNPHSVSLCLTPHPACKSRLRLRHCAGDRSERAVRPQIHRELSRRRRKGAAEPVEEGSCAARRTLSFSLSVLSHTCWLSIR